MKKICLLVLSILTNIAIADSLEGTDGGYYVGIGAGYSQITGAVQAPYLLNNTTSGTQDAGSIASQLYFGYDIYKWLGLQLDYNAAFEASYSNSYKLNEQLLGGSVLLHLPFTVFSDSLKGISLYTKLGFDYNSINFGNTGACDGCSSLNNSADGFTPLFGLGGEWDDNEHVGYRLEWDYAGGLMAKNNLGDNIINTSSNSFFASIMYHF